MNKNILIVIAFILAVKVLRLLEFELLSVLFIVVLVLIYLRPKISFIRALLLLEIIALNLFIFFILTRGKTGLDH